MPTSLESTEYDLFDYRHFDEVPLTLEEAAREAARLRALQSSHVHRIVPTSANLSGFRVESTLKEAAYSEILGRWVQMLNRLRFRR